MGKITDKNNNPIYGSTIFIKEANQGLACNEAGEYQTTLPAGTYTVEYRCLGYESVRQKVTVSKDQPVIKNIILSEKAFELTEVVISNKEDPAYEIMRKAIAKAPYHEKKLKYFKAEAYIKGNMELTKISAIVNSLAKSDDGIKLSDFKDKLFLQESFNEIEFTAPDKYEQTVKAFSSSAPDDLDPKDAMRIMRTSIYTPRFGGMISPLNPKAFTYYRFRYEGFSENGKDVINKIKIIPKYKDPELLSGYLYIADNTWDVREADLSGSVYGISQKFIISYSEVAPTVYLPITYSNQASVDILGVEGYFNYFTSIKYQEVQIDESLVKEMEKNEKKENEKTKKSFEIPLHRDVNYVMKSDTLANKRDSLFWLQIRNVPLGEREIRSYEVKDSIQHHVDSVRKNYHNSKFEFSDLITGGKIGGDSTKISLKYGGLFRAVPEYNFVDGFWIGQKFELGTKWKRHHRLTISPMVYYATARKRVLWQTDAKLKYSPMRLGELTVSGGDVSADYNSVIDNRFDNAISSLLWGKNGSMFFQKKFIKVNNGVDLANGLRFISQVEVAKRSGLSNNTDFSIFGGKNSIRSNLNPPDNFDLTAYAVGLMYTPRYYYSVSEGRKDYRYAKSPTLYASYYEGFSGWLTNNSRFRKLKGGISQSIQTDLFSSFRYELGGGSFLGDKDNISFADYQHFNASDLFLVTRSPKNAFYLLDTYEASTNKYWAEAHFEYNSKYILFKRLPFLQGKLFNETLSLKYLYTPSKKNYNEVGYSVNIFKIISAGVHCSFEQLKYESVGVRLLFNFNTFD